MDKPGQVILGPTQLALREALVARDGRLAEIYFGAIMAVAHEGNPERFSQCAQSLRELIRRLTYVQDEENLGPMVKKLRNKWEKCGMKLTQKAAAEGQNGFLRELDKFFDWVDNRRLSLKKQAAKIMDDLDPMFAELPREFIQAKVTRWLDFRNYFEQVAHHNHYPDEGEFKDRVEAFGIFLLDLLRPKTSANFSIIEQLVDEGEADANSRIS